MTFSVTHLGDHSSNCLLMKLTEMEHGKGTMFHVDNFTDFSRCKRVFKHTEESNSNLEFDQLE